MEPHVESHVDSHVGLNVETFIPTSGGQQAEPHSILVSEPPKSNDELHVKANPSEKPVMVEDHIIDTPIIDKLLNDVFNDNYVSTKDSADEILTKNHQNVEAKKVPSKKSLEVDQVN